MSLSSRTAGSARPPLQSQSQPVQAAAGPALPARVLRPMTVADIDAVMAVEVRAYSFPWTRGNFIDSLAAGYAAHALVSHGQSGEPAQLLGYFVAMTGVDEMHLLNITVAPEWQGQGLGHALLDAVQQLARSLALHSLWLEVRESNHRARALYQRRGFADVGLRRGYYPAAGRREDALVMSMALDTPPAPPSPPAAAGGAPAPAQGDAAHGLD